MSQLAVPARPLGVPSTRIAKSGPTPNPPPRSSSTQSTRHVSPPNSASHNCSPPARGCPRFPPSPSATPTPATAPTPTHIPSPRNNTLFYRDNSPIVWLVLASAPSPMQPTEPDCSSSESQSQSQTRPLTQPPVHCTTPGPLAQPPAPATLPSSPPSSLVLRPSWSAVVEAGYVIPPPRGAGYSSSSSDDGSSSNPDDEDSMSFRQYQLYLRHQKQKSQQEQQKQKADEQRGDGLDEKGKDTPVVQLQKQSLVNLDEKKQKPYHTTASQPQQMHGSKPKASSSNKFHRTALTTQCSDDEDYAGDDNDDDYTEDDLFECDAAVHNGGESEHEDQEPSSPDAHHRKKEDDEDTDYVPPKRPRTCGSSSTRRSPYLMFAAAMRSTVREELRKTTAKVRESSVLCAVAAKWRSLPDTEKEHWKHKALRSSSPHHSHNSHNSTPQKHSHTSPQNASTLTPPQPKRPRKAPPAQHLLQNQEPQNSSYNPHDVLRPYTLTFYYPKGTRIQQQNSESQTDPEITQCTCSVDAEVSSDSTT